MKPVLTCTLILALLCSGINSNAQSTPRPNLFNSYPGLINCTIPELEKAFISPEGNTVVFSFSNNTNFTGLISSTTQRYSNLKSVVVKLNNLQGAIFAISKRINNDNTITYVGRIIHEQFADGYELKYDSNGNYFLNKIILEDILQDHQ